MEQARQPGRKAGEQDDQDNDGKLGREERQERPDKRGNADIADAAGDEQADADRRRDQPHGEGQDDQHGKLQPLA